MKTIEVYPEHTNPTHHVSLTDGETTIGLILIDDKGVQDALAMSGNPMDRTPLKFSEGRQKYSDMVYPWSTIAQESWVGGRASKEFETDATKYFDSRRLWSLDGDLKMAGLEQYTTGMRSQDMNAITSVKWISLIQNQAYTAIKFTASASYSVANIYILLRRMGTPETAITVELCSDTAGNPGAVLQSGTISTTEVTDILAEYYKLAITAQAITSGTAYWVKIRSANGTVNDHWKIGTEPAAGASKYSNDDTTWTNADWDINFRCTDADSTAYTYKFFQYRYQQYAIRNKGDGTQPELWVNGDHGVADSNSGALTTLVDASKSAIWVADEFINSIVWVIKGPGSTEEKPWRLITDNSTTTLTVDSPWLITHTTATEYIIIGGPAKWRLIAAASHNLNANNVTDIKIFNSAVYFAQGDASNIHRWQWYCNTNVLAYRDADDGTNKAYKLETLLDNTDGQLVWKANNSDASALISVADAARPTTWANMTFGTAVPINEDTGMIRNIKAYNDQGTVNLWVLTEGFIYKINNGLLDPIPLEELKSFMHYRNANCITTHNVFLLFPWGNGGIQRYYDLNLDDVGPNRDEGLPANRQGIPVKIEPHAGKYLIAVDAGTAGYSSVHFNNGSDNYHEIYRGPAIGQRIWDEQSQVIPGGPNRLWVAIGSDMIWIPLPTATVKPSSDSSFIYTYESMVESGWIHADMPDVWKFFHSFKLWSENLVEDTDGTGGIDVQLQYKWDTETTWSDIPEKFYKLPSQEIKIQEILGVNAKRFKYRAILRTKLNTTTPIVKSIVMENAMRIQVKYSFTFRCRVADNDVNLQAEPEDLTGIEKMDIIKNWVDTITPLYMRTLDHWSDQTTLFLQPIPYKKNKKTENNWILQAAVVEI